MGKAPYLSTTQQTSWKQANKQDRMNWMDERMFG
jgi:hypothetical protein